MGLLAIGGLNTVLSLFYYLRVVKVMTLEPEPENRPAPTIAFDPRAGPLLPVHHAPPRRAFRVVEWFVYLGRTSHPTADQLVKGCAGYVEGCGEGSDETFRDGHRAQSGAGDRLPLATDVSRECAALASACADEARELPRIAADHKTLAARLAEAVSTEAADRRLVSSRSTTRPSMTWARARGQGSPPAAPSRSRAHSTPALIRWLKHRLRNRLARFAGGREDMVLLDEFLKRS